jgi:hypothetical protein
VTSRRSAPPIALDHLIGFEQAVRAVRRGEGMRQLGLEALDGLTVDPGLIATDEARTYSLTSVASRWYKRLGQDCHHQRRRMPWMSTT